MNIFHVAFLVTTERINQIISSGINNFFILKMLQKNSLIIFKKLQIPYLKEICTASQ